ncbi:Phage terminase large subunit (GpA) [Caballeronia pedi]|uniref:Phage terminase large subunit (GpA) n=1 Tax=Caballeronia pedi TaxID=1777141 RepID=A0A158E7G5_9BURK|nr:phage terminase large subunit family protein [Caballeronia pedi]SAL02799.1 Phage terminase large subunit (GpA) [Caballeronia pedi]
MAFMRRKAGKPADVASGLSDMLSRLEQMTGYRADTDSIGDLSFIEWCEELARGKKGDGTDGLKVDGKPFRLDNRPALRPLYEAIPKTRADAKDAMLVVMKATQLGLTVWEVLANIYMAVRWEPVSIGMFMPAQATAIHKSEHRFMRMVRSAPELYKYLVTGRDVDGKKKQVGEGNVLTRKVGESLLLFLWTTGKVTTESIPMDIVTLDEVQEMALDQIDKVRARTGDSDIQFTLMLSTANMPELDIDFWYRQGTQEVWHTECPHCQALSDLSDPAAIFPTKSIGYNTGQFPGAPMNEYVWTCPTCGGWIEDPQVGRYIVTNAAAPAKLRSFLLPRTISPKMTPRKMVEAHGRAKTGNQKKSFWNRTLARPYIDADQLPVTMVHCLAAMEAGIKRGLKWEKRGDGTSFYCAGIDQMGSFNAMIIKKRMPDGRQAVVHVEAIFNDNPFERCGELMDQFGIAVCVVEQLPNVNDARRFANKFPGRVFLAGYADLRDDQMVWGDQLSRSDMRTAEEDRSRFSVTLNQYKCMQTALFRVREGTCLFPNADELEQDVIEDGKRKRIAILRDWVFFHFTKTALVIDDGSETENGRAKKVTEARKLRMKVVKVGIDPHYSYANMLCDVAWARAHGTSTFIMPDTKPTEGEALAKQAEAIGLPQTVVRIFEELPAGERCGRCVSFDAESSMCGERDLATKASAPGCPLYIARSF